ncbi:MAG: tyrosine-type recombinase/integrase [Saprospiraceae bacterium]|nr:tyrosine-type recombinase/integrase [Saprospiraceae bacterium]
MQTPHNLISIRPLYYQDAKWIALYFTYDAGIVKKIKGIQGRRYSQTHRCWYLPCEETPWLQFRTLGIPYVIEKSTGPSGTADCTRSQGDHTGKVSTEGGTQSVISEDGEGRIADNKVKPEEDLMIIWNNQYFQIRPPLSGDDVTLIKSLAGSWWHAKYHKWMVRSSPKNLEALQRHFACWDKEAYEKIYELVSARMDPVIVQLYTTPQYCKSFIVKIQGYKADFQFLKSLPDRQYDQDFKRWILPLNSNIVNRLKQHYEGQGAKVIDRLPKEGQSYLPTPVSFGDRQQRLLTKYGAGHYEIIKEYTDALLRMRYSWNTVSNYTGALFKYLQYLGQVRLEDTTANDANVYLSSIAKKRVSESLIHQAVNAIKFYFDKVKFVSDFQLEKIQRPKKGSYLPTILSIREIDNILRSVDNLKHLAIIYTLYGGGLRLNELLSLKVTDIHWDRNQIFIRSGKGKEDRVVMLSHVLKTLLVKYFDAYQPTYWLFEGINKKFQYSEKSVQNVIKRAAKKTGITRRVTTHTLRHCFATHLLDNGTDVRFIQELLGHKDIKTTLIYTHVTTSRVTAIKSPLDALNLCPER